MIGVVDYGVGNLASVVNMLRRAGADVHVVATAKDLMRMHKLLLPGVGHFDHGMKQLNSSGLRVALDNFALDLRRPVLGICLGGQILGEGSEEGSEPGLGWIPMTCRRFPDSPEFRVPHMGWSALNVKRYSPLLSAIAPESRFYFVHSYFMNVRDDQSVVATASHGIEFSCAVQKGLIFGTQFHPEKSLRHGLAVLKAFAQLEAPVGD